MKRVGSCLVLILLLIALDPQPSRHLVAQSTTPVSVNGAQTFQTIDGFGVSANAASWNGGELRPALDLLVGQLGATIWRVVIDNADWEASNDNADPLSFNWSYYDSVYTSPKFEELWSTIAYLNQKGIRNGMMLSLMGPVAGWMGGSRISVAAEDEWVEMVTSLVYYARVSRGLTIPLFSPLNEPDWDGIEGPQVDQWQYARLMGKLAQRLDAVGLTDLRLVGPDTAAIGTGVAGYMPEMMSDAVVMEKIDHFAFHNYAGDSGGADAAIRNSSHSNKNFWITEVSNIWDAMAHIGQGPSATLVWDAYDSVYNHAILAGRGTNPPNDAGNGPALLAYNTGSRTYTPRKAFYEHVQLFRYVPPGSRRIAANASASGLTLYAFHDQSGGRVTLVGRNVSTSSRTLNGSLTNLPSFPRFEFYQTTASVNFQRGTDVTVSNGTFIVQIAAGSVFTLTATTAADAQPPTISMTSPGSGVVSGLVTVAASASDDVGVAGVEFFLDGNPLGAEDTQAPFEVQWNTATAAAGEHQLHARARDAAGNAASAPPLSVMVDNSDVTPPSVAITDPQTGATVSGAVAVTASVTDGGTVAGVQFLLDGNSLGGEDAVAPYSVTWNTLGAPNGFHTLAARARDAAGNQTTSASVGITVSNAAPPAAGLVAAFGFEEGAGTQTADSSGAGHVGLLTGAVWTTAGRFGKAVSFDGVNDVITVADTPHLDLTGAMTMEAWVRPTSGGGWRTVLLKEAPGELAYGLYANDSANRPSVWLRNTGPSQSLAGTTALPVNTWSHVAATYDGMTLRFYLNGALVSSRSVTVTAQATSNPLRIGGNSIWGEYFVGSIDEVRIYGRALSGSEIQADMFAAVAWAPDTEGPVVTVNTPVSGATLSGTVAIAATATDNVGVAGVQFFLDRVALGPEDTGAPYGVSWNTTSTANGTYVITAQARDAAGNITTSNGVPVTVNNADSAPPSVVITSPAPGSTVNGTVTVTASASDDVGLVGVQFLVDGLPVGGEDAVAPYAVTWDTTAVANGAYVISARARDGASNEAVSAGAAVTVANEPPAPSAGPVAEYGFEEGTGVLAADASGHGQDGVLSGATWTTAGRFGRALSFDGIDDLVTVADAPPLDLVAGMTIEAWVRPSAVGGWRTVALKERTDGFVYALYASDGASRASGFIRGTADIGAPAALPLDVNVWSHLAVTYDGSTVRVFVNGSEAGSQPATGSIATSTGSLVLGGNSVWGEYFAGLIDEVRIYDRPLSAAEIQADMSDPVAWVADTQVPAVVVDAPVAGTAVSGVVTLVATASDNVGVAGVQFFVDGVAVGTEDTTAPYTAGWDSATVANGSHSLTARATDAAGNITTSPPVSVVVGNDTTPPTVAITAPASGATVSGAVTLTATASDGVSVGGVQFFVDGVAVGIEDVAAPYSVSWQTSMAPNGTHAITARARDQAGNQATSATVTVTVANGSASQTGLVAAYGFEEGSGATTADATGQGHVATVSGATWTTAGRFGRALSFDGVNDMLTIADSALLDLSTGMTLEAWVRPTSTSGWRTVVLKERPGSLAYSLYAANGQSRAAGYGRFSGDIAVTAPATMAANAWTHLAFTYDGATMRLYVNGTQVQSVARTGPMATSSNPLRIGGNQVWSEFFAGVIDEVRVYNRARTQAEIQTDMNSAVSP